MDATVLTADLMALARVAIVGIGVVIGIVIAVPLIARYVFSLGSDYRIY